MQGLRYQLDALRSAGVTMPMDEDASGRFGVPCEGHQCVYHAD